MGTGDGNVLVCHAKRRRSSCPDGFVVFIHNLLEVIGVSCFLKVRVIETYIIPDATQISF